MASHRRNGSDARLWYANSTRTSIGLCDGTGVRIVSPRSSLGESDLDWYYHTSAIGQKFQSSDFSVKLGGDANSLRDYLNKPLPALPSSPRSYSTVTSANGTANSSQFATPQGQVALYDVGSSMELDTSSATEFALAMTGVDLDTNAFVDNHLAANGTHLVGRLTVNRTEAAEREKLTETFYTGTQAEEAPGLYYAPIVDETSGYANYREGMDEFPDMWQSSKTKITNPRKQVEVLISPKAMTKPKPILKPKSRKALKTDVQMVDDDSADRLSRMVLTPPTDQVAFTDTLIKGNKRAALNKRSAPESSPAATSQYLIEDDEDDLLDVLPSKRLRVTEHTVDQEIPYTNGFRAVSVHSDDSDYSDCDENLKSAKSAAFGIPSPKRTSVTLTSFPGQFPSFEVPYLKRKQERNIRSDKVSTFPFGNPLHPNNIYTHTNFIPDPNADTLDYTQEMMDRMPTRTIAWEHATTMSSRAAKVLTRTPSEDHLRREAHLECAGARLEGVTVGEYRYYQGHMSVEEYVDANMCVCWGACICSKLCTRFGDVLCPCSKDILLPED